MIGLATEAAKRHHRAETLAETEARKNLAAELKPRWDNQSISVITEMVQQAGDKYREAAATSSAARHSALQRVYEACLAAEARGEMDQLVERCRENLGKKKIYKNSHPILAVLRAFVTKSDDKVSRWGGALRYAYLKATAPEDLSDFLKQNDGVDACAKAFHRARKTDFLSESVDKDSGPNETGVCSAHARLPNAALAAPRDRNPVAKCSSGKKERKKPKTRPKKIANVEVKRSKGLKLKSRGEPYSVQEVRSTPEFEKRLSELAGSAKSRFIDIKAHLSKRGTLTLQRLTLDQVKTKAAKEKLAARR